MTDKDDIIRGVRDALDGILEKTKEAGRDQLESTKWWTNQVMAELCVWGLKKGFLVCASSMKDAEMIALAQKYGGKIQGEWLYDLTCLEYHDDGRLKRIPLVAESEWGNSLDIDDDFHKLILARADVRVMVCNGNYYRTEGKPSIESGKLGDFRKYITECEHTQTGDTYLFAARLHEGEGRRSVNHRFDYHRFDASTTTCFRPVS